MLPLIKQHLPGPINDRLYHVHLPGSFYSDLKDPTTLRGRPRGVEQLRRFWGRVPKWWPVTNATDSAWPLYLYYQSIKASGQTQIAQEIVFMLKTIKARWNKYLKNKAHEYGDGYLYEDDFFRHHLKAVSSFCYPLIFSEGPAYMLMCHLHALNAKAPYTKDQILADMDSWTSSSFGGKEKGIDMETFKRTVDGIFQQWETKPAGQCMTYRQFCDDPMRWGTSGGAPPVKILGRETRNKWAWAFDKMFTKNQTIKTQEEADIAGQAEATSGNTARVALKEETQKTREIITTPLNSYLRQCYLLYRREKVPLPSPISSPSWLPSFEASNFKWYGCIDGERFDHTVPKEAIEYIIQKLGEVDDETKAIAEEEIKHLNELKIEWNGTEWKYGGGVLSGWRLTSLIGSVVSYAAARYIMENTKSQSEVSAGVLGDDIVLTSYTRALDAETLVNLYNKFGLRANLSKTVSAPQGEFLRKVRSQGGSWAFPALDMKTLTHANPWVTNLQFAYEEECATGWTMYLSRLLPHATRPDKIQEWIMKKAVDDLNTRFKRGVDWNAWMRTPMSAGGGGYIENSDPHNWTIITKEREAKNLTPYQTMAKNLGIMPTKMTLKKITVERTSLDRLREAAKKLFIEPGATYTPAFKDSTNIFRTLWALTNDTIGAKELSGLLRRPLPHRYRMWRGPQLAQILSWGKKTMESVPSVTHTRESFPHYTSTLAALTRQMNARKSGVPTRDIKAVATVYAMARYRSTLAPYGTW